MLYEGDIPFGRWTIELTEFNLDFSKGKIVFSPQNFLIHFKVILGVKTSPKSVVEKPKTLRTWEKREKKRRKEEKKQEHPQSLSGFRRG